MPRSPQLEKEVTRLRNEARWIGFALDVDRTIDEDSYIVSNKKKRRAVIIGRVDINGTSVIASYKINIPKWKWAEAEGFTKRQMIEKLGAEIFNTIESSQISSYLSGR